jgi:hypothetical protein
MFIKSSYTIYGFRDKHRGQINVATIQTTKTIVILLTIAAFALTASTFAAVQVNQSVNSIGTIATSPNIGIYSDASCTNSISSMNWGSIAAGGSSSQTVYVKNTGTGSMTLSMIISAWSPTNANSYITISWNKEGNVLASGQVATATITVTVSSSITGISSFSNTITFYGTS